MLERPARIQVRSENFTATEPPIPRRQTAWHSGPSDQHPFGVIQRFLNKTLAAACKSRLCRPDLGFERRSNRLVSPSIIRAAAREFTKASGAERHKHLT